MLNQFSVTCCLLLGLVLITAFPIEIKDIQYLFPPQNTLLDASGQFYQTQIDKQVGDSEEAERKAEKACIPKQNAAPETNDGTPSEDTESTTDDGFTDNSPINGTLVDDPMEVKIYKPECDD